MRRLAPLLAVALLLLVGCGGGNGDDEAQAPAATTAATGATTGAPEAVAGEAVFAEAGCGGCHTLAAAGSNGAVGPNLDELAPDADEVEEQVRSGGGGMPAFEDRLSDTEIDAVSRYVADSAAG
jgi:mono/diheme cytochrome c family protein